MIQSMYSIHQIINIITHSICIRSSLSLSSERFLVVVVVVPVKYFNWGHNFVATCVFKWVYKQQLHIHTFILNRDAQLTAKLTTISFHFCMVCNAYVRNGWNISKRRRLFEIKRNVCVYLHICTWLRMNRLDFHLFEEKVKQEKC